MNILVISNAAWDDCGSLGNTLSNWFGDWEHCKISSITYRSDIPNNKCCSEYYVISPFDLVRHFFCPSKIGIRYNSKHIPSSYNKMENGAKGIMGFKRYVLRSLVDILYHLPLWRNKQYDKFIQDMNPDVVFLFAIADSFQYENLKYIKNNTNAKIVMSIEDDVYGAVADKRDILSKIEKKRLETMLHMADKLYGASQMMCDAYARFFNLSFAPLYKGCEFHPLKESVNKPIEMVYAGNLLYGRLDTLSEIAETLREINKDVIKFRLNIYSGTNVTNDQIRRINDGETAIFHGQKPFEEIKIILNHADITLHVESFEAKMQKLVRYSFSTKIVDCLQSGNVMMVVGPKNIASVEYSRTIPGAFIIDDTMSLHMAFSNIASNPTMLVESAKSINAFAVVHHDIIKVRKKLQKEFYELL